MWLPHYQTEHTGIIHKGEVNSDCFCNTCLHGMKRGICSFVEDLPKDTVGDDRQTHLKLTAAEPTIVKSLNPDELLVNDFVHCRPL